MFAFKFSYLKSISFSSPFFIFLNNFIINAIIPDITKNEMIIQIILMILYSSSKILFSFAFNWISFFYLNY